MRFAELFRFRGALRLKTDDAMPTIRCIAAAGVPVQAVLAAHPAGSGQGPSHKSFSAETVLGLHLKWA